MQRIAIVTGANSGLGRMICTQLLPTFDRIIQLTATSCDLRSSEAIAAKAKQLNETIPRVNKEVVLINCAGMASINWIDNLTESEWDEVMSVNLKGPFLLARWLTESLRGGTILNITSRAARFPMRASLAYNASKAAADMMTRQMARELYTSHDTVVFGVAPNKLANTPMSRWVDEKVCAVRGWTPEEAANYEKSSRVVKEETPPETLAEFIGFLLSSRARHKHLNGCIINYGD